MQEAGRRAIDAALMRGGTSRGPVMLARSLPGDEAARNAAVIRLVGGDASQTDGVGGGAPTTSKAVVIDPVRDDPDGVAFNYAVANIVVGRGAVDWDGTCGNMTAAVPVFALEEGLMAPGSPARARLRNLSTGGLVDVSVAGAARHRRGDEAVVATAYLDPGGAVLGSVLPTGVPIERLAARGRTYAASLVDVTHPYLFLLHDEVVGDGDLRSAEALSLVEELRGAACVRLGLVDRPEEAMTRSPAVPRVVLVYRGGAGTGLRIAAVSMGVAIGTVPVTAAMCLAAARHIGGTLVAQECGVPRNQELVVAAPSARMAASAVPDGNGGFASASVERTARTIMQGRSWA